MCDICDGKLNHRQLRAEMKKEIRKSGWYLQAVEAKGPDSPTFLYTVGLTTAGLPELILSGVMDPYRLAPILNRLAKHHLRDEFVVGKPIVFPWDAEQSMLIKARAVTDIHALQQGLNYYSDPDNTRTVMKAVQIVWSDHNGQFPDGPFYTGSKQDFF